jgi:hypothetical protein
MSCIHKPFAELLLKLVAFDTIDNRDVSLQLLASGLPGTCASTATPFAEIDVWHNGGLNE